MEIENRYASRGIGGTALGLSIGALGVEALRGGLGGLFGTPNGYACSEDHHIDRYEASQSAKISQLETEIKLRDANIYTDSKLADIYEKLSGRINCVEGQIAQQGVYNAVNTSTINCINNQIAQLMGLTKTIVPAENICPTPMSQYNSWTAPTAGA